MTAVVKQSETNWQFMQPTEPLSRATAEALLDAALDARTRAYARYSKFEVGAAVLVDDDIVIPGCNVENASYGGTVCAERVAIFNAVCSGYHRIRAIAVIADQPEPIAPCGICLQVISEFSDHAIVLMANLSGMVEIERFSALFPRSFTLD